MKSTERRSNTSGVQTTSLTLLNAAKDMRSEGAWKEMLELYSPRIYELCRRAKIRQADLADTCHEVWMAVVRNLGDFERTGEYKGQFRAWLKRITHNKIIDYFRKKREARILSSSALDQLAWPNEERDIQSGTSEDVVRASRLLALARERFGEEAIGIFVGLVVEGKSAADIASETGKTTGAIYSCKSRILTWLRNQDSDVG